MVKFIKTSYKNIIVTTSNHSFRQKMGAEIPPECIQGKHAPEPPT